MQTCKSLVFIGAAQSRGVARLRMILACGVQTASGVTSTSKNTGSESPPVPPYAGGGTGSYKVRLDAPY